MNILIIDTADPAGKAFNRPLTEAVSNIAACDTVNFQDVDSGKSQGYTAIILSGVPLHYSFEMIAERRKRLQWIEGARVPVLGICLGHELIGDLFHAEVFEDIEAEDGMVQMKIVHDDPIFANLGKSFIGRALHRGSLSVPNGFILLASSDRCKNQVMKHSTRKMYGFQFHPELSSADGKTLLKNFIEL